MGEHIAPKQCIMLSLINNKYREWYIASHNRVTNRTNAWDNLPNTALL